VLRLLPRSTTKHLCPCSSKLIHASSTMSFSAKIPQKDRGPCCNAKAAGQAWATGLPPLPETNPRLGSCLPSSILQIRTIICLTQPTKPNHFVGMIYLIPSCALSISLLKPGAHKEEAQSFLDSGLLCWAMHHHKSTSASILPIRQAGLYVYTPCRCYLQR
jgi:hypothetical protein